MDRVTRRKALKQVAAVVGAASALGQNAAGLAAQSNSASRQYPPAFPRNNAKKVMENERVIVWDVTWPKGEPTPVHEHELDHVSITLVSGDVKQTRPDGTFAVGTAKVGGVNYIRKGVIHQEEGTSDVPRRAIFVQLK